MDDRTVGETLRGFIGHWELGWKGDLVPHVCHWSQVCFELKKDSWSPLDHWWLDSWLIVVEGNVLISLESTENPCGA